MNELEFGVEYQEDDSYYQPGFGSWRLANNNAECPNGCGPVSVIRFKQFDEVTRNKFILEHFCNSCLLVAEHGHMGNMGIKQVKEYAREYSHLV